MNFIYDHTPLIVGQVRRIRIIGNGPFKISVSCFVDNPPPAGFRPCAACGDFQTESGSDFNVEANLDFWKNQKGNIQVEVTDSNSIVDSIILSVEEDNYQEPQFKTLEG